MSTVADGVAVGFADEVGGAVEWVEEEVGVDLAAIGEVADECRVEGFVWVVN